MSLNPLNELKRRLEDEKTSLPKRLCLARNVVQSHHFPTAPKERIVAEWLQALTERNSLKNEELKKILDWLSNDLTSELKSKLIQIVSLYLQANPLQTSDIQYIILFLENSKISTQLNIQIDDYLTITIILLQYLRNTVNCTHLSKRILNNFIKYYRESKKKLDFIIKLLNGENIETIFSFLDTECRMSAIDVCQNILFPISKKSYFISFLQTLIRKDNLEELIAEKGDNIQSVIKIMNTFFDFPKNRSDSDTKFLHNFIDVFVSSFQKENQIVFAFYIMVTNVLRMEQTFITPAMNLPPINLGENDGKVKRTLFLHMLEVLLNNEVDINVRLTDTFGEKISKVEIKKNFTSFLQAVMMRQLKLEGKLDKTTLQIIKVALKLDPILIEQKKQTILPAIMTAKKHSLNITESYTEMIKCLLEILFKLSRGTSFISEILPPVKDILEAGNTEQFELKQRVKEAKASGEEYEKLESKIITGSDVFPQECVDVYGKLTSELMFRQNKDLLETLQKDLEVHCLMMLEEGFVSPSIIVLTEVLSSILSSFLYYNKMAGHTVPLNVAEDFWNAYKKFEEECLSKFGQCVLKLSYNPPLILSFLKLCQSFAQLKLLNIKYSNVKLEISQSMNATDLFDLSDILPCLSKDQWTEIAGKIEDYEAVVVLNNLLLIKTIASQLLSITSGEECTKEIITLTKAHLIKQISENPSLLRSNYFCNVLFSDLEKTQTKQLAKCLIKLYLKNPEWNMLQSDPVVNNRPLLNYLVLETAKNISKCFENKDPLSKMLGNSDFNMVSFVKEIEVIQYFNQLNIKDEHQDDVKNHVNILKQLPLCHLEENYQLVAIFLLLAIKKSTNVKKLKRSIDTILQSIYELSLQQPDLYQIFPVEYIFSFQDNTLLDLLTLKLKNSNNLLIIKSLLELAVKKVRTDSQLVKSITAKLLKKNKISDMESFNDPTFQVTCLILPLIVKQKKAITASAFRSILADLQDKLHSALLESFKDVDFSNSSILVDNIGNSDDSVVQNESNVAILNAMPAYYLTLSKYCESTDGEEIKNLNYLWSSLEFFIQSAIKTIENVDSKLNYIESSIQLLNVILRHIKKLETHRIFQEKDKIFLQIYRSIKERLILEQHKKVLSTNCLEDLSVTLKFVCELSSVECYGNHFINDLSSLVIFKKPNSIVTDGNSDVIPRKVFKYLWSQCLKANVVGSKCVAMSKLMNRICKNLRNWIRQHYDIDDGVARVYDEVTTDDDNIVKIVKIDDVVCELIRLDLDSLSEILLAAKKISLDYKFVDSIFELQHLIHFILHNKCNIMCDISWHSFFTLYDGCVGVLNSLIVAREEILEDRWACYLQCYRALVWALCARSPALAQRDTSDTSVEDRLAEIAHNIEKLTQTICKRKKHLSRIAAYTVADLCTSLEKNGPPKMVRQHLENSVALLIEASDSSYAMPFLKRALAGSAGQMTMTNLYTMYKRYHKYVGNA